MTEIYGISSDFGFAYQRFVFIDEIIHKCINPSDIINYEKDDDISSSTKESDHLSYVQTKDKLIQCKTGDITEEVFIKVFKNWLLLHKSEITSFVLILEQDIAFSPNKTELAKLIINEILEYNKKKKTNSASILYKLGHKYNYHDCSIDELMLKNDLDDIINKYSKIIIDYDKLYEKSFNEFVLRHCNDVLYNKTIQEKRFERFVFVINKKINDNESKRLPTSIDYQTFSREISTITKEINDHDPYRESYSVFKMAKLESLKENEKIMNLREVKLLKKIYPNDEEKMFNDLVCECYYRDLRDYYDGVSKHDRVVDAEIEVKSIYDISDLDSDIKVFYKNVLRQLLSAKMEILVNQQYKNGALIFLSGDECDEDVFIDWNGENAK